MKRRSFFKNSLPVIGLFAGASTAAAIQSKNEKIPDKSHEYNVLDFGAKGDEYHLNTKAINQTIDKANVNGGGIVIIPPGIYLSGTIYLKSYELIPGLLTNHFQSFMLSGAGISKVVC